LQSRRHGVTERRHFSAAMPTRATHLTFWLLTSWLLLLTAPAAQASAAQSQPPAEPGQPQPPQPTPEQPPPPEPPPPEPPPPEPAPPEPGATPGLEDRMRDLEGKLEGVTEPFPAMQSDIAGLKRLKISGYLQGRYEWHDDADYGLEVDANGRARQRGTNRFLVRRGRLKTTYAGVLSEYVLQIDVTGASPEPVTLKDAEASFHMTNESSWFPSPTKWEFKLTIGQFKVPFGFEVLQSSGDRELPERTAVIRALYPAERDRGLRVQYKYSSFRLMVAMINGNFTTDPDHFTFDQSSWKDVAGRVGADFEHVVFGVSGHTGRFLRLVRPATVMQPVAGYERYSRLRVGADVQVYYDIQGLGGFTFRAEGIWARDKQLDFGGTAADRFSCKDAIRYGWYATAVQNIGEHLGVAVRFDQYDPVASSLSELCPVPAQDATIVDRVNNLGVAVMGYVSGNLKATLAYDHFGEQEGRKRGNDALTLQLQAKF
jgi:hypothetical protein